MPAITKPEEVVRLLMLVILHFAATIPYQTTYQRYVNHRKFLSFHVFFSLFHSIESDFPFFCFKVATVARGTILNDFGDVAICLEIDVRLA